MVEFVGVSRSTSVKHTLYLPFLLRLDGQRAFEVYFEGSIDFKKGSE